jgi:hypothetical protein
MPFAGAASGVPLRALPVPELRRTTSLPGAIALQPATASSAAAPPLPLAAAPAVTQASGVLRATGRQSLGEAHADLPGLPCMAHCRTV